MAEIQYLSTGVNLIEAEIKKAVGEEISEISQPEFYDVWCEMVIHNAPGQAGFFEKLEIDPVIEEKYIRVIDMAAKPGDYVKPFTGANKFLGDVFLRFDSREELDEIMSHFKEWMKIVLR